jgi:hypothetical protein
MSLSEREQRILSEIEREFASSPLPGRVPLGMRLPFRSRPPAAARARWRRRANGHLGWLVAMVAGLLVGIAILSAGLVLGVPAMMAGGAVLTQLGPFAALLAGLFRGRLPRPAGGVPGSRASRIDPR